jgi:hypothetical protein
MHGGAVLGEYAVLARRYDRRWSAYIDATIAETLCRLHLWAFALQDPLALGDDDGERAEGRCRAG